MIKVLVVSLGLKGDNGTLTVGVLRVTVVTDLSLVTLVVVGRVPNLRGKVEVGTGML